jgi:hypothetical protein
LYVVQDPEGQTVHKVYVKNSPIRNRTFGATLVKTFSGNTKSSDVLDSVISGSGRYVQIRTTTSPSWVAWYEVQVFSNNASDNTLPSGVKVWGDPNRPVSALTSISNVTNLGGSSINNGLKGDVIVGYFKPLHESFDGPDYTNQEYFIVVNGLSWPGATVAQTRQRIRLNFTSDVTQIQRMRRSDGVVELLNTTANGSSRYYEFDLDGGSGDLFKIYTGAPFVGANGL